MAKKKKDEPAKPTAKEIKSGSAKTAFENVGSKDPKRYPFDVIMPKGFDFKLHKALKKRDFTADHLFYEYRAIECENKAAAFRVQAEEAKKLGSVKDRGRAKRLVKLTEKMGELKQQLEAQGVNVKQLLADAMKEKS